MSVWGLKSQLLLYSFSTLLMGDNFILSLVPLMAAKQLQQSQASHPDMVMSRDRVGIRLLLRALQRQETFPGRPAIPSMFSICLIDQN